MKKRILRDFSSSFRFRRFRLLKYHLIDLFLFLKWFVIFGLGANIIFCSLIGLVGIVTIPGFIAGLVAFKNNAHAYKLTPAFVFLAKCAILFVTFLWMCTFGWIPLIFPFIWCS